MNKKLKSLKEHNEGRMADQGEMSGPLPNGIACPNCETELLDSTPHKVLTSNPAQYNIHCPKCDYQGYRF